MDLRKFIMDERVRRTRVAEERIQKSKNEFDLVRMTIRRVEKDEMDEEVEYMYCLSTSVSSIVNANDQKKRCVDQD